MAAYQESNVTGVKWKRCKSLSIDNPLPPGITTITFNEEEVILVDSTTLAKVGTDIMMANYNATDMIDIIDPNTLLPIGKQVSEGEVYPALFSKYLAVAKARDAANAPPVIVSPVEIPPDPGTSGFSGDSGFSGTSGDSGVQ